jgi:hypothetical protein
MSAFLPSQNTVIYTFQIWEGGNTGNADTSVDHWRPR